MSVSWGSWLWGPTRFCWCGILSRSAWSLSVILLDFTSVSPWAMALWHLFKVHDSQCETSLSHRPVPGPAQLISAKAVCIVFYSTLRNFEQSQEIDFSSSGTFPAGFVWCGLPVCMLCSMMSALLADACSPRHMAAGTFCVSSLEMQSHGCMLCVCKLMLTHNSQCYITICIQTVGRFAMDITMFEVDKATIAIRVFIMFKQRRPPNVHVCSQRR